MGGVCRSLRPVWGYLGSSTHLRCSIGRGGASLCPSACASRPAGSCAQRVVPSSLVSSTLVQSARCPPLSHELGATVSARRCADRAKTSRRLNFGHQPAEVGRSRYFSPVCTKISLFTIGWVPCFGEGKWAENSEFCRK